MKGAFAALVGLFALCGTALGTEGQSCDIPGYFLSGTPELKRVPVAVKENQRLRIAVVGTGSSALAGPDGPSSAYPARLEAILRERLPGTAVKVIPLVRTRQTADDLAKGMSKLLTDEKPDLVIWQTGTIDAIRRIEPDDFRAALEEGIDTLEKGGADVILMNMQYSPRTDIMLSLGPYADAMRVAAQQHEVPLFDRLSIMRHWSDTGAFDLYVTDRDNVLAHRVHDCIGRGIAAMIMDAAHLRGTEHKAGQ
jgi:lysophospholipase L1-like esterase